MCEVYAYSSLCLSLFFKAGSYGQGDAGLVSEALTSERKSDREGDAEMLLERKKENKSKLTPPLEDSM